MQLVQRGVMLVLAVLLLIGGKAIQVKGQINRQMERWEEMHAERFLGKIAGTGVCTYEDFVLYQEALQYNCAGAEVQLEEYQKEMEVSGKEYWYLVSWEEILEALARNGTYEFHEESILELHVRDSAGTWGTGRKYCEVVRGKE